MRRGEETTPGSPAERLKDLVDEALTLDLGRRVQAAARLEADLEIGLTMTLDDIGADEAALLRVLRAERNRKENEDLEQQARDAGSAGR